MEGGMVSLDPEELEAAALFLKQNLPKRSDLSQKVTLLMETLNLSLQLSAPNGRRSKSSTDKTKKGRGYLSATPGATTGSTSTS